MDTEFLQNVAEMDGGSLAAFNGDILCGRHVLIDFISKKIRTGNVEGNPGNNAVLTGLDEFCGAIGFCLDLYKK